MVRDGLHAYVRGGLDFKAGRCITTFEVACYLYVLSNKEMCIKECRIIQNIM